MLVAFFRLMACLPLSWLHWMGRVAGRMVYAWPGKYRRRLRANARQAGYADGAFAWRAAAQAGAMVFETPKVWLRPQQCLALTRCTDDTVVREALARGKGIVYLTAHLGCFEITARHLTQYGPITVMYRSPRMTKLAPVMAHARDMPGLRAVPATMQGVRSFVRALRRGEAVGMLPDQVPRSGEGVWASFFGRPAYTMTLAGKLAQADVEVILTIGERLPRGQGWRIHYTRIDQALPPDPAGLALVVNQAMESLIRQFPDQYLWSYNRYKVPRGAPRPPDNRPS